MRRRLSCTKGGRLSAGRHSVVLPHEGTAMHEIVRSAAITPEHLAVLNSSEWFGAIDPAFRQAVLGSSRVIALSAGQSVFHRGDAGDGLYCVLSGAICFGAVAHSGKESIVAMAEAPQWFGEIALFDGGARTHDGWGRHGLNSAASSAAPPDKDSRRRSRKMAAYGTIAGSKAADSSLAP
jgi:Cyclic nucleotide-binding domain